MEWKISQGLVDYETALAAMEQRVAALLAGQADELIWLLEHPPLYTAGTSAKDSGLLDRRFPVYQAGRGGEYTYHGPGQRVVYVMLDLKRRNARDVRAYVRFLERWIIGALATFDVEGFTRDGRVGVWVHTPRLPLEGGEAKIAAIGIRIRKWVTYHGFSINVNPDLAHYAGIVPCGIRQHGITSLEALGARASMKQLDEALRATYDANSIIT